jgi:predicted HTH transcriptional regulator
LPYNITKSDEQINEYGDLINEQLSGQNDQINGDNDLINNQNDLTNEQLSGQNDLINNDDDQINGQDDLTNDHINSTDEQINLSQREMEILNLISGDNKLSYKQIASTINISETTVKRSIGALKEKGYIKGKTANKNGEWIIAK